MWNEKPLSPDHRVVPSATLPDVPEERRTVAWVGASVVFKGELFSAEDMTIDGRVEGRIDVHDHAVRIGMKAHIQADIVAARVIIDGTVIGSVKASDVVEVRDTASVEGDISAGRVIIADGASLRGRVETTARPGGRESAPASQAIM